MGHRRGPRLPPSPNTYKKNNKKNLVNTKRSYIALTSSFRTSTINQLSLIEPRPAEPLCLRIGEPGTGLISASPRAGSFCRCIQMRALQCAAEARGEICRAMVVRGFLTRPRYCTGRYPLAEN
jgi:hypothetical protein